MTLTVANPAENRELENAASDVDVSSPAPVAPVERLPSQIVLLLQGGAMQVDIAEEGVTVLATDRQSGMFGEGSSIDEALVDLHDHLILSLRDLETHEANLTTAMAEELTRLRALLGQ